MRTTLDLPEDLHGIATSLARHGRRSLGQVVAELMRRGLEAQGALWVAESAPPYHLHPDTGLPVVRSRRPVTDDDVRALDDEG
jgi:hypothetical protein